MRFSVAEMDRIRANFALQAAVTAPATPTGRTRADPARPADRQVEVLLAGSLQWLPLTEWQTVERARARAEDLARPPKARRKRRV